VRAQETRVSRARVEHVPSPRLERDSACPERVRNARRREK